MPTRYVSKSKSALSYLSTVLHFSAECNSKKAEIGKTLRLVCNISHNSCRLSNFKWFMNDTEIENATQREYKTDLIKIEDGGQIYSCMCGEDEKMECFIVFGVF